MSRNLIILVVVVLVIGGGAFFFLNSSGSSYLSFLQTSEVEEESMMEGNPREDEMVKEVDEDAAMEMKDLLYQYKGELSDVTTGEVQGINTGGEATGVAKSNFDGEQYLLLATFEGLPEPASDDFYEGWIVQKDPFMFISTGIVKKVDGVYTNVYKSGEDLTNYDFYVLTIEPNDGDPAPADHILEGTMN